MKKAETIGAVYIHTYNFIRQNKGITLVALVVTIVVLLILAGITITMLFGENGIIKKAQLAKEQTENKQSYDIEKINGLAEKMNKILGNEKEDFSDKEPIFDGYCKNITMDGEESPGFTEPGLSSKINRLHTFYFLLEYEGKAYSAAGYLTDIFTDEIADEDGNGLMLLAGEIDGGACFVSNDMLIIGIGNESSEAQECPIGARLRIYDMGIREDLVVADGFVGVKDENGGCSLQESPKGEFEVPDFIEGYKVTSIVMSSSNIGKSMIFNNSCVFEAWDVASIDKITLKTTDVDWIFKEIKSISHLKELDLSQCGDEVTIPEEVLSSGSGNDNLVIYVSPAVKAKYATYDKVVAK